MIVTLEADEIKDKAVCCFTASSSRIYLPKSWAGRKVKIALLPKED